MAFVYILKSEDGKYYIGSTEDLKARLKHHAGGYTPSTKRLGKIKLVFSQEYNSIVDARIIERKIKKLKRKDYIEKIISDRIIRISPR